IRSLVLPWPSSLDLDQAKLEESNLTAQKLFVTTEYGGSQTGNFDIQPNQESLPSNLKQMLMGVSIIGEAETEERVPRAVVIGDSDFLTDNFVTNTPENLAFGLESIAWLTQEQSLAEIQL